MGIPRTVGTGSQILRALRGRDVQAASALATAGGRKRIAKLVASPADPCAQAIAAWSGTANGRVNGTRGMCSFAELPEGRVVVLDLFLERGGWRVDDVRIVDASEFADFGRVDEATGAV